MPSLSYRLGLSQDPGGGVGQLAGSSTSRGRTESVNLGTDVTLLSQVKIGTSYRRTVTRTEQTGGTNRSIQTTWPNLDIQWGQIYAKLGLGGILGRSARASTKYQRDVTESKVGFQGRDRRQTSISWSPLLNLSTTLPNGVQLRFTSSVRNMRSEEFTPALNVTRTMNRQFSLDLSKSLRITREITIPVTGEKERIQSRLDLALGLEYRQDRRRVQERVQTDRASFTLSAQSKYEFTRSIHGEGRLDVGQDSDRINPTRTARHVSLFLTASFTF